MEKKRERKRKGEGERGSDQVGASIDLDELRFGPLEGF